MHLKISYAKWRPFCFDLNVIRKMKPCLHFLSFPNSKLAQVVDVNSRRLKTTFINQFMPWLLISQEKRNHDCVQVTRNMLVSPPGTQAFAKLNLYIEIALISKSKFMYFGPYSLKYCEISPCLSVWQTYIEPSKIQLRYPISFFFNPSTNISHFLIKTDRTVWMPRHYRTKYSMLICLFTKSQCEHRTNTDSDVMAKYILNNIVYSPTKFASKLLLAKHLIKVFIIADICQHISSSCVVTMSVIRSPSWQGMEI